ncbi:MAG: metal-dependent hydrolase [Verrucomicrobiota bacterium]
MDSLTQAAMGAVVGERVLGRPLGRRGLAWGALFGTIPDLDILAYPFLDPIAELYWHRGFSHSVFGILLLSPLFAWLLFRWWKRKPSISVSFQRALCFVLLNFATHVLIDCFTMYGTQLAEPFSNQRFGLNNLFIIDPLFTAPLLIWIAAALFRKKEPGVVAPSFSVVCSVLLLGYTTFSLVAQSRADDRFREELTAMGIEPNRGLVTAVPFNTLIWRGLYETEDRYWISYWAVTDKNEPLYFAEAPRQVDLLEPYRGDRAIDCVLWFSEEFLLVEPQADGKTFLATDLRFVEFWPEDSQGLPRTFFAWKVAPAEDGEPAVFEPYQVNRPDVSGLFRSLRDRLQGNQRALLPSSAVPSS